MNVVLLLALLSLRADGDPGPGTRTRTRSRTWTWTRPRASPGHADVYLELDVSAVRHRLDPRFLSVTIDASLAENPRYMALLSSAKLQTLTAALAPAFLRFGGTRQDFMEFQPPGDPHRPRDPNRNRNRNWNRNHTGHISRPPCGLTLLPRWLEEQLKKDWAQFQEILIKEDLEGNYRKLQYTALTVDQLYSFSSCCGLDLVFGLNALLRTPDNTWDGSNAALLLRYCQSRGYRMSWELGNEPNSFKHKAGVSVDGQQLGRDFAQLRDIMSQFELYRHAALYGPDVCQPRYRRADILDGFLDTGAESIDAVTFHHYYVNGRETSLKDFLDPELLDTLRDNITKILEKVNRVSPRRPVWLGETSSAYGGGAAGLSDAFVAGFMWLDKLGLAASMGLQVVMRQALIGSGRYLLVDTNLDPLPDYWVSILHKRLVGSRVLAVQTLSQFGQSTQVRVYLHCANRKSSSSGAVVLLSMNLGEEPAAMFLPPSVSRSSVEAFVLQSDQPGQQGVCSRTVMLNGVVLKMVDDRTFPDLRGTRLPPADRLLLPPFSLAFFLFHEAGAPACS